MQESALTVSLGIWLIIGIVLSEAYYFLYCVVVVSERLKLKRADSPKVQPIMLYCVHALEMDPSDYEASQTRFVRLSRNTQC